MGKRKERILKELYNVTQIITQPEITPVLRGSCRMQGPVDERDYDIFQTNTVCSQVDKGFSGHSKSQKVKCGTCNVCSTPCSSCFHINRALMGSKTDEFSDETSRENAVSFSVNDFVPTVKSRKCEIGQRTASEISNLASGNSSQDSFSENAESNESLRTSDVSGANEDVDMLLPRLSSAETIRDPEHPRRLKFDSEKKRLVKKKFKDSKGSEGHDDNISCVSRANEANNLSSYDTQNVDTINFPCCAPASSLVPDGYGKTVHYQPVSGCLEIKSEIEGSQNNCSGPCKNNKEFIQEEIPGSKEKKDDDTVMKVQNAYSHSPNRKSLPCDPNLKDLEEASDLHLQGESPECSREHVNTCIANDVPDSVCRRKCTSNNCNDVQNSKVSQVGGNSEAPLNFCPMLEAETEYDTIDPPAKALIVPEQNKVEKVRDSNLLPELKETSLESHHLDGSDESDILEHDVKVCDICGDSGREDLLAICCRCTDGAEHTYCMREMLDNVPEGDWLCEECKFDEEIKNQRKNRFDTVVGNEKNQISVQAGTDSNNNGGTSDSKGSDLEGNRINKDHSSLKISGKRHADDTEVSSAAKKQVLEPMIGSPNISGPIRVAALSRENSFKNLDRRKVKPVLESFSGIHTVNATPEAAPTTGVFIKSNSFTFSNAKPKVKLVDQFLPQKHKISREPVSVDAKEGASRLIGKSMSFKSANSGRSNESKVKMLSPRFSHVQDLKGLKQAKEHNLFDRKNSFKTERPLVNSPMASSALSSPKVDKKLTSRCETISLPSANNNRETKVMQSDSKSITSFKPTNHAARRDLEIPVPLGEVKRQSSCIPSLVGAPSSNRISGSVQPKPIQASPKDDYSSNSCNAERPLYNVNESLTEGLSQSREVTTHGEQMKETSGSRSKQITTAVGRYISCRKCKDIGHSEQYCTVGSPKSLARDASSAKSSREVITGNKLKAAIEAAMLKKPGIYRKNRVSDHSDELDGSSSQLSSSSNTRNTIPADDLHEGKAINRNTATDSSCTQTTVNNVKQFSVLPAEAVTSRTEDACLIVPWDGKPSVRDLPSHTSASMSPFLKISAIPEHDYMWQGAFEIYRSGPVPDLHNGIQAHLSTSASPKVPEVATKLSRKLALNEVPRLSTWPIQFQENGVEEDNIALFFFAKDLESYEKSYKILVDIMMRKDLALKGIIDGVELLIFPSNQLPQKSQCWNMMFFLWGVFRGRRASCLQHMLGSPEKFSTSQDIPMAIMSLPDSVCSLGPVDKSPSACSRACNVDVASEAPASIKLPCLSSTERINGDCDTKVSSLVPQDKSVQINVERQESRVDYDSSSTIPRSNAHLCTENQSTNTSQDGRVNSDCKKDGEMHASAQVIRTVGGSKRTEKMPMHWDTPLDNQHVLSQYVDKIPSRTEEVASAVVSEENFKEGLLPNAVVASLEREREMVMGDPTTMDPNPWHFKHRKHLHVDPNESVLQAGGGGTSRVIPWNGVSKMLPDGSLNKEKKTGFVGYHGSPMHEVASSSTTKEKRSDESCDGTVIPDNPENSEKHFFPVDPLPVKDIGLGDKSSPWKMFSSIEDGLHDRIPNLELALGAETKSSRQGIPPFLVGKLDKKMNQDQLPDNKVAFREELDEVSASLSLSLSFPFPDEELAVKPPATKAEQQLLPERRHVKTSLLLFGGSSNK